MSKLLLIYYAGILHFIVLLFIAFFRYWIFFFLQLRSYGNPTLNKPMGAILPRTFAYSMSLCHVLEILTIIYTFSPLYLLWRFAISDLWCYHWNCFRVPRKAPPYSIYLHSEEPHHKWCVRSDYSIHQLYPFSLPVLRLPNSPRHNNMEIKPINNLTMASKYSSERKGQSM